MGAGDELFSAFGHAAICVADARAPRGRCYNYGTADFRTPVPLTWNFVRGRALFWVSVTDVPTLLWQYAREDRAVWRQHLRLEPAQARELAAALEASTDERVKYYRYHHFNDNCTTRIRDLVDAATGGALSRAPEDRGRSFREWAREGFRGDWPMLVVTDLLLGRSADRRTDSWSAMFLPSELRAMVAARLGSPAQPVIARRAPLPSGSTTGGTWAFALAGALLALSILGGAKWASARGGAKWPRRLPLALAALLLGLIALVLDALALLSTFPELTRNELLLAFWPTDFALPFLSQKNLRLYSMIRLSVMALIVIAHLGLFVQPLAPLLLVAFPVGAALAISRAP